MTALCACGVGFGNTGQNNCNTLQKVIKRLVYVNTFKDDGTRNYVDPSGTLNASWKTALINQTDASIRWFPTPELKNINSERGDATYETWEDQTKDFVHDGVRNFTGIMPKQTPTLLANLNKGCNTERSVYAFDLDDNLIGYKRGTDGYVYPIPVNAWRAKYVFAKDSANPQIVLSFEFSPDILDEDLVMISASAFTDWVPSTDLRGLLDVTLVASGISQTGVTIKIKTAYGPLNNPTLAKGWLLANLVFYNVTDSASITATSVTESTVTPGTYVVVIPSQTVSDVIRVTPSKSGYMGDAITYTVV